MFEKQVKLDDLTRLKEDYQELLRAKTAKEIDVGAKHLKIYFKKSSKPQVWIIKFKNWKTENVSLDLDKIDDIIYFRVIQTGVINKTQLVLEKLFTIMETVDPENDKKYFELLQKLRKKPEYIYDEIPWLIQVAEDFSLKHTGIDFNSFLDKKKVTKNSVVFDGKDNLHIFMLSIILKFYMPMSSTTLYKYADHEVHKLFFKKLTQQMGCVDLVYKIHDLIMKKIFRTIKLDFSLLSILQMKYTKTQEDFALMMFDFIISSILVIYDLTRNPTTFLATSISSMISWEFQDIKNLNVIYKRTEDLFDISNSSRNLTEKLIINKVLKETEKFVLIQAKKSTLDVSWIHKTISEKKLEESYYDMFIVPLWKYIFSIKYDIKIDLYSKVIIQLMLYFSLKIFLEEILKRDTSTDSKFITEKFHYLEIFKSIALEKPRNRRTYSYSLQSIEKIYQTTGFSFYGFKTLIILVDYMMKLFENLNSCTFKVLDGTEKEYSLNKQKLEYLEEKLLPFIYVILDSSNEKNMPNLKLYREFTLQLIKFT